MYLVKNKKSPNYQVIYFVNGKRTTISSGTNCKKEAERFLISFQRDLLQKPPRKPVEIKNELENIILSKFLNEYLEFSKPTKSAPYLKSIELSFRQFIYFTGDIRLSEVDVRLIDKFITITFSRAQRASHLYYRTLKAAFSKAVAWNYIKENPFRKVKFPRMQKKHPVFISVEEFKQILAKVEERYLRELFTVAFYTGMRAGEIVNMRVGWIDFENNFITIKCSNGFHTKSRKERIIPMNHNVSEILQSRIKTNSEDYVFTRIKAVRLNEDFISKKFKKAVRAAELNDEIHFHTLRHSFASMLVQKGVSLYVVKELLGHEDLSTTQIYSHLQSQNLKDAVNLI